MGVFLLVLLLFLPVDFFRRKRKVMPEEKGGWNGDSHRTWIKKEDKEDLEKAMVFVDSVAQLACRHSSCGTVGPTCDLDDSGVVF